jgi:corrinoid protein of di/trimethylamine methyltransferase
MSDELLGQITENVLRGETENLLTLTKQALEVGMEPLTVINDGLIPGMDIAGEKFAQGEYFLPHLLIAAKAMQGAMAMLEPELQSREQQRQSLGTVVIGTVLGDIHEIGKSLVGTMLSVNGFEVHDLGVDVTKEAFIESVKKSQADILGMSALLTTTMVGQREVIESLVESGLRDRVKVIVGGSPVSQNWADSIGADGYAADAMAAVKLVNRLMNAS